MKIASLIIIFVGCRKFDPERQYLCQYDTYKKYGPLVRFQIPYLDLVFVFDPDLGEHILRNGTSKCPIRPAFEYIETYRVKHRNYSTGGLLSR